MTSRKALLTAATTSTLAGGLLLSTSLSAMQQLETSAQAFSHASPFIYKEKCEDGKCGEGKCAEGKCADGKCGQGKCK